MHHYLHDLCKSELPSQIFLSVATCSLLKEMNSLTYVGTTRSLNMSWINRWKSRHQISFKRLIGEASSVDLAMVNEWLNVKVPLILEEYQAKDINNVDETALFWKMLPDRTMAFRNEDTHGGKMSKEQITVLVGRNMAGDKLPLIVIGKAARPCSFPQTNAFPLPLTYKSNPKAWMTGSIFERWVWELEQEICAQKRKIVVILDNCPAHPRVPDLAHVSLIFLPPNTTPLTQPMDGGIIKTLKHYYRKSLAIRQLAALENGINFKINLFQSLQILQSAWDRVSASTIVNCFKKVGFIREADVTVEPQEAGFDLILEHMKKYIELPAELNSDIFVSCDNDVETSGLLSDQDIVSLHLVPDDHEEIEESFPPTVSTNDAFGAIELLQRSIDNTELTPILSLLQQIQHILENNCT